MTLTGSDGGLKTWSRVVPQLRLAGVHKTTRDVVAYIQFYLDKAGVAPILTNWKVEFLSSGNWAVQYSWEASSLARALKSCFP